MKLGSTIVLRRPRFGDALATVRTAHRERLRRQALKFLKEAKVSSNCMDESARINNILIRGADLKPVLSYLSGCQQI